MAKQVEQLEKEKKELQERLKNQEKKVTVVHESLARHGQKHWTLTSLFLQIDYFERAKRLEEIPLIKKAYEEQRVKDMELWELQEEERVRKQVLECKVIVTSVHNVRMFGGCRSVT